MSQIKHLRPGKVTGAKLVAANSSSPGLSRRSRSAGLGAQLSGWPGQARPWPNGNRHEFAPLIRQNPKSRKKITNYEERAPELVEGCARLEGWQQARPSKRPSFENAPQKCGTPQDEGLIFFTRSFAGDDSAGDDGQTWARFALSTLQSRPNITGDAGLIEKRRNKSSKRW